MTVQQIFQELERSFSRQIAENSGYQYKKMSVKLGYLPKDLWHEFFIVWRGQIVATHRIHASEFVCKDGPWIIAEIYNKDGEL